MVSQKNKKKSDPLELARFLEELSWLLDNYKDVDFKEIAKLRDKIVHPKTSNIQKSGNQKSVTLRLVGTLPGVLSDQKIFKSNSHIVDFALSTLGIEIPRWHKKSKNELIGHIVCNAEKADAKKLDLLVKALNNLVEGPVSTRKKFADDVKSGRTWNEVIQSLLNE